jgi:Tol biopolymer transport system component
VGLQCTQDGRRMAYLTQVFGEDDRNLDIRGEDPTDEPLSLPDSIQGISWSPDGTQMALSDYDGFDFTHSIGILDAETGEITELTSGEDFAGSIAWSPDGERLAYYLQSVTVGPVTPGAPTPVRTTDVHVISTDGGESEAITPGGAIAWYDPEWSPDGDTLLVAGLQEQNFQLYEIDAEGGEPRPLTQSDIFKRGARYSPDGSTIAYTGSVVEPAVSLRAVALHSFGIFLLESDGSNERAFTADPRENPGAQVDPYLDAYFMSWCAPGPWLDELWTPER